MQYAFAECSLVKNSNDDCQCFVASETFVRAYTQKNHSFLKKFLRARGSFDIEQTPGELYRRNSFFPTKGKTSC